MIEIAKYFTSEGEYNKCPFNKIEGFIELCNFMGIENKENCKIIDFDQANKMSLKVSTVLGTIDALYEFFQNKKMFDTLKYFQNINNKYGGIYLIIKEDKSFGYIIIWPGNMKYLYKKIDEPQKDLLLSLVRIGFSLCEENIICLTEKQKDEFDFQAFKELESEDIPQATESKINFFEVENNSYFKLGKDLEIKFQFNINETINDFKLNDNSIFLYISSGDSLKIEPFDKMPKENLNYNIENVIINENFELDGEELYSFVKKFKCLKEFINEVEYFEIQKIIKNKIQIIKIFYFNSLSRIIDRYNNKIICEFCKKKDYNYLYAFSCDEHCLHVSHKNCFPLTEQTKNKEEKKIQKNNINEVLLESLSFYYEQCKKKYVIYSELNHTINKYIFEINNINNRTLNFWKNSNVSKNLLNLQNEVSSLIISECEPKLSIYDNEIKDLFSNWKLNMIIKIKDSHEKKV